MSPKDKPLVWMHGEVKTPPFSKLARLTDAIVIAEVFSKKTGKAPKSVIETCKARLREYDNG